jgi:hypothetical protein
MIRREFLFIPTRRGIRAFRLLLLFRSILGSGWGVVFFLVVDDAFLALDGPFLFVVFDLFLPTEKSHDGIAMCI